MDSGLDGAYVALKGYRYQFDKTILEIFKNTDKEIKIEQIQDLGYDDYIIQVKHHDTIYNESQQRAKKKKPIIQLLKEFTKDNTKRYVLYIYFKGNVPYEEELTAIQLDNILSSNAPDFTAHIKESFVKKFKIIYSEDFFQLHIEVISIIQSIYRQGKEEAEIYYSIISSHLLDIILLNPPNQKNKRKCSKIILDKIINDNKKVIFNSAYLDYLDKEKYFKLIRKTYFTTGLNIEPFERFFIIEANNDLKIAEFKELILLIKKKWSKNTNRTKESFAPYICFRGISQKKLIQIKTSLFKDGYHIKDGHDFLGADFSLKSITAKSSAENKIFFRIISDENLIIPTINYLESTIEIYQFYVMNEANINFDTKQISIKIQEFSDIKNII